MITNMAKYFFSLKGQLARVRTRTRTRTRARTHARTHAPRAHKHTQTRTHRYHARTRTHTRHAHTHWHSVQCLLISWACLWCPAALRLCRLERQLSALSPADLQARHDTHEKMADCFCRLSVFGPALEHYRAQLEVSLTAAGVFSDRPALEVSLTAAGASSDQTL